MEDFISTAEIRWSDLDPNLHVRHSVYYDFGAFSRINFFAHHGITSEIMLQHNIGPILFREECLFKKEIRFGDKITINIKLENFKSNYSRWRIVHEIFKSDTIVAAFITVDGAWIDTQKRKLTIPPDIFKTVFELSPKTNNFTII